MSGQISVFATRVISYAPREALYLLDNELDLWICDRAPNFA